jgi:hypothetical protein
MLCIVLIWNRARLEWHTINNQPCDSNSERGMTSVRRNYAINNQPLDSPIGLKWIRDETLDRVWND